MTRARRSLESLRQPVVGALLALMLTGPVATAAEKAAEAAAPQHGGGGFALLLLDYRQGLERLTAALREGAAELAEGVAIAPAQMTGALDRVTAGSDPLLLAAGLTATLGGAFLARHAVRRRLAGAREGPSGAADGFGQRLARACYRLLVDLLGLSAFALVALVRPGRRAA